MPETIQFAALRDKFKLTAHEDSLLGGDGLDGVYWFGYHIPMPGFVAAIAEREFEQLARYLDSPEAIAVAYLGLGTRPAVIAGPAFGIVHFEQWQPAEGPAVRRTRSLLQFGDDDERIVLGHLLAWGAGDLLDPREPVTKREYLRGSVG